MGLSLPGATPLARVMLPLRLVAVLLPFCIMGPVLIVAATLRAVYLKCVRGKPSDILKCAPTHIFPHRRHSPSPSAAALDRSAYRCLPAPPC